MISASRVIPIFSWVPQDNLEMGPSFNSTKPLNWESSAIWMALISASIRINPFQPSSTRCQEVIVWPRLKWSGTWMSSLWDLDRQVSSCHVMLSLIKNKSVFDGDGSKYMYCSNVVNLSYFLNYECWLMIIALLRQIQIVLLLVPQKG